MTIFDGLFLCKTTKALARIDSPLTIVTELETTLPIVSDCPRVSAAQSVQASFVLAGLVRASEPVGRMPVFLAMLIIPGPALAKELAFLPMWCMDMGEPRKLVVC